MADVTYYVAMPFLQDDSGTLVAGAAEECQSPTTALRRAETMSRATPPDPSNPERALNPERTNGRCHLLRRNAVPAGR